MFGDVIGSVLIHSSRRYTRQYSLCRVNQQGSSCLPLGLSTSNPARFNAHADSPGHIFLPRGLDQPQTSRYYTRHRLFAFPSQALAYPYYARHFRPFGTSEAQLFLGPGTSFGDGSLPCPSVITEALPRPRRETHTHTPRRDGRGLPWATCSSAAPVGFVCPAASRLPF